MNFLTDLADQAVVLPLVLAVSATLFAQGWQRGAAAWLSAVAATFGVMLVLKIVFLGCQPVFRPLGIVSPSGHTAAAAIVAGGLMAVTTARLRTVLLTAVAAAVVIGATRLILGVHSLPEVILGGAIGVAGAGLLSRLAGVAPVLRLIILAGVVVVVFVLFHGVRLPAEGSIRAIAALVGEVVPACRMSGAALLRLGIMG